MTHKRLFWLMLLLPALLLGTASCSKDEDNDNDQRNTEVNNEETNDPNEGIDDNDQSVIGKWALVEGTAINKTEGTPYAVFNPDSTCTLMGFPFGYYYKDGELKRSYAVMDEVITDDMTEGSLERKYPRYIRIYQPGTHPFTGETLYDDYNFRIERDTMYIVVLHAILEPLSPRATYKRVR